MSRIYLIHLLGWLSFVTLKGNAQNYEVDYLQLFVSDSTRTLDNGHAVVSTKGHLVGNKENSAYYSSIALWKKMPLGYRDSLQNSPTTQTQSYTIGKKRFNNRSMKIEDKYIDTTGHLIYIDFKNDSLFNKLSYYDPSYYTVERIPTIDWQISHEKKTVLEYECTKAITKFRGREYEAWFTSEIPIISGPWKFTGLPGLILEIKSLDNQVSFEAKRVVLPTSKKVPIFKKEDDLKFISLEEYFVLPKKASREYEQRQRKYWESMPGFQMKEGMTFGPVYADGTAHNLNALYFIEKRF